MWVVVPVKRFSNAKTRLASLLSEAERESLAQAMLHDVLGAVHAARLVAGILVVSREVRARYAVERLGGLFLEETGDGLNAALQQAGQWLTTHGQRGLLMVPGDVPLVTATEVDDLIAAHGAAPAVTLAPDRELDGTNALAVSPADALPFSFGRGSFAAHRDAARAAGVTPRVLHLNGIAHDIDNPMDLRTLVTHDAETETLDYLCDSGIARRVLAPRQGGVEASGAAAASHVI
ncbi:MAG: 2-phospho-L-lactate guanylyltransferase [Gammaproteobacteria bacterium]|nr:2-phospho-L-lactate guanylyltransferase [Gammaproteobacteria bacterium]MCP5198514.1 2-phospho-L-lactate guanylyltransferase [Gammaproteobacteria bacterium]